MPNMFPILGSKPPECIPWSAIEGHERQAQRNHHQTLKRLAERGGLSYVEALAVIEDKDWKKRTQVDEPHARESLIAAGIPIITR